MDTRTDDDFNGTQKYGELRGFKIKKSHGLHMRFINILFSINNNKDYL